MSEILTGRGVPGRTEAKAAVNPSTQKQDEAARAMSEQRAFDAAQPPVTQKTSMREATKKDRENQQYQLAQQKRDADKIKSGESR